MNFGPLNRSGGDRRLNVAVTRARYRMIVVSSMTPEQLKGVVTQSRSNGPRLLADYLAYAQRGGLDAGVSGTGQPESEFEGAVRDALVARGYEVDCQVGVSGYRIDLAVKEPRAPGLYVVGIECDGATYHSARTARDRDRIRQMVLESLGWNIVRVWSTDWIRDPVREADRLVEHIERLRGRAPVDHEREAAAASGEAAQSPGPGTREDGDDGRRPVGMNWEASRVGVDGVVVKFPGYQPHIGGVDVVRAATLVDEAPGVLAELMRRVVEREAPVHIEQVYERVRATYGQSRTGKRMRESLDRALRLAVCHALVVRRGDFLWRTNSGAQHVQPRGPGLVVRPPAHICPEEWEAAVLAALDRFGATERSQVIRHVVAGLLGASRVSAGMRERAEDAVDRLQASGRILQRDGSLCVRSDQAMNQADRHQ